MRNPPDTPPLGIARKVAPGVFRVSLPIDFQQDHINVWVLEDGRHITIVDTGVGTRQTAELWDEVLQRQFAGRPLRRVICTHWHPDHMGCAGWLLERAQEPLWATRLEWETAHRVAGAGQPQYLAHEAEFLRATDCDARIAQQLLDRAGFISKHFLPPPDRYRRYTCGEPIDIDTDSWQTLLGQGHSPEHAALYSASRNVLIGGDMVLPDTTTFVGIEPSEGLDKDPITAYLESLQRLKALPDDVLVLPSHGEPFIGLHTRIAELEERTKHRLNRVFDKLEGTMSANAVARQLRSREPTASQLYLGLRSAFACLNYLAARQAVRHWEEAGVWQYART